MRRKKKTWFDYDPRAPQASTITVIPPPTLPYQQIGPLKIDPNDQHDFSAAFLHSLSPFANKRRAEPIIDGPLHLPDAPPHELVEHREVSHMVH
jgi:hypothetical protein